MIAYYPRFREGAGPGLVPKLGGLPWGFPQRLWPVCEECGGAMSHLAQLPHEPRTMPVGDGQVLFIFKCESGDGCSFWEHDGGANAVVTVDRSALGDSPTPAPESDGVPAPVLREIGITGWDEKDDGAPPELEAAFYRYGTHSDLPKAISAPHNWAGGWHTKSGGVPCWTANGAQAQPDIPPGRLLLQIDNWLELEGGETAEIANFCSDGTAYVFVDRSVVPPTYSMFINR
ncbi:hypothetical protein [Roseateles sp. BYS96W]|uniref:DUF1963 domain-containing protein n=1 Tax=Pelomonas nitida TaxID=3299027 RepID=A0ABW7G5E0_9BURK